MLTIAKVSNPLDSLIEKICVNVIDIITKIANNSTEKIPIAEVIMKNQKEEPAVTATALNREEDSSILNWINHSYNATLSQDSNSNHYY